MIPQQSTIKIAKEVMLMVCNGPFINDLPAEVQKILTTNHNVHPNTANRLYAKVQAELDSISAND